MRVSGFRFQISHIRFAIAFPTVLYVACNALNIDRLSKWFPRGDDPDLPALAAFLFAGLCLTIAVFTLVAHRLTIKPFAVLLTFASAAATYFISKYGVAIDTSMMENVVHTDPAEVGQLLSPQMLPYVALLMVVPVLVIVCARITFGPLGRHLLRSAMLFGVMICLAIASLALEYEAILRASTVSNRDIITALVPINVIAGSIGAATDSVKPYLKKSENDVRIDARVTAPGDLVVVLAVGESSRRKNFSVFGYTRRNTNPELQKLTGLHFLNGVATRASTLYALPKILAKDDVKLTTIVSRVGIPSFCLVHYTLYENCAAIGETEVADCGHGGKCYDEDVVPLLRANLATYAAGYRFVVLHLGGGSHGPNYNMRIPPEFRRFEPTCDDADVAHRCSLEQIYNSYDNTILYVDHVLGRVIRTLDGSGVPYVLIYLSDHGESLLEGGRLFHGVPPGMSLPEEQAEIPLIVKSSLPIAIARRAEYGQPDVFDTVLDLFSIESPKFDRAGSFIKREEVRPIRAAEQAGTTGLRLPRARPVPRGPRRSRGPRLRCRCARACTDAPGRAAAGCRRRHPSRRGWRERDATSRPPAQSPGLRRRRDRSCALRARSRYGSRRRPPASTARRRSVRVGTTADPTPAMRCRSCSPRRCQAA